jgi:hypothetical protein
MDARQLIHEDFGVLAVIQGTRDDTEVGVEVVDYSAYIITVKLQEKCKDTLKEAHKLLDEAFHSTHAKGI